VFNQKQKKRGKEGSIKIIGEKKGREEKACGRPPVQLRGYELTLGEAGRNGGGKRQAYCRGNEEFQMGGRRIRLEKGGQLGFLQKAEE